MTVDEIISMAKEDCEDFGLDREESLMFEFFIRGAYQAGYWEGKIFEREACAKVCDELAAKDKLSNYYAVAGRTIRERGEK